jgi:hypothetical protein
VLVIVVVEVVVAVVVVDPFENRKTSRTSRPVRSNKDPIIDVRQQQVEHGGHISQVQQHRFLLSISFDDFCGYFVIIDLGC